MKSGELKRRRATPTDGLERLQPRFISITRDAHRQTEMSPINFHIGRSPMRFITAKNYNRLVMCRFAVCAVEEE